MKTCSKQLLSNQSNANRTMRYWNGRCWPCVRGVGIPKSGLHKPSLWPDGWHRDCHTSTQGPPRVRMSSLPSVTGTVVGEPQGFQSTEHYNQSNGLDGPLARMDLRGTELRGRQKKLINKWYKKWKFKYRPRKQSFGKTHTNKQIHVKQNGDLIAEISTLWLSSQISP